MCNTSREPRAEATEAALAPSHEVVNVWPDIGRLDRIPIRKRSLRVLIVDDHRDGADILAVLVKMWGHEARVAYAGDVALRLAATYQPDVMLLDLAMPQMDGCQLAHRLRREERFKDTLLIAIPGCGDAAHRLLGAEAGFDHYLLKPVEPSTLEAVLLRQQSRLAVSCATPWPAGTTLPS
jgi:DNA-binding response OmpR family regulator